MSNNAVAVVRTDIQKMQPQFQAALPAHIPPERFLRTALTAINSTSDIGKVAATEAGRKSIYSACMKAAQDGLVIDGREAALVTFNSKQRDGSYLAQAQYMPMVAGIMKKARNSGQISSISAHVVHQRDHFFYVLGDEERIEHKPALTGDRGPVIAVYAIARLKDGSVQREVMSVAQVEAIRGRSRSAQKGPWVTDWEEMARKTVIRRIAKYLPASSDRENGTDVIDTIARDDDFYEIEVEPTEVKTTATRPRKTRGAAAAAIEAAQDEPIDNVVEGEFTEAEPDMAGEPDEGDVM